MIFPNDAISVRTLQAVATTTEIIPSGGHKITILFYSLDATAQNSQMLQCLTNGTTYKTLSQKINTGKQLYFTNLVLPENTQCYLKTFDNTLTEGAITYVPYDLSALSPASSTPTSSLPQVYNGYTYGELVSTTFLFYLAFLATYAFYWVTVHRPVKP